MYFVYVLFSDKLDCRYVGSCKDVRERLKRDNQGKSRFTKGGFPRKLMYTESYSSLSEARLRERFLKTGVGRKWLDETLK
ncbi:MAG: GIY-YIG nuclease family protein [Bacteroidetes bacterium]|nr:GIY-YIG nuclease family protein [Bacteroidota bacterium]